MPQVPGVNAIIDDGTAAANAHASDWWDANPFESVIDSCWCQVLLLLILTARHIEFVHTMCGSATIRLHHFVMRVGCGYIVLCPAMLLSKAVMSRVSRFRPAEWLPSSSAFRTKETVWRDYVPA